MCSWRKVGVGKLLNKRIQESVRNYGLNLQDLGTAGTYNDGLVALGKKIENSLSNTDLARLKLLILSKRLIQENTHYTGDTAFRVVGEVLQRILRGKEVVERKEMDYSKWVSADHDDNYETYITRQKVAFTLYNLRKNRGYSRHRMADYLGIKISRYYRYEMGLTFFRDEDAEKLTAKFRFSLDRLYDMIMEYKEDADLA